MNVHDDHGCMWEKDKQNHNFDLTSESEQVCFVCLKNGPLNRPKKMPPSKKLYLIRNMVKIKKVFLRPIFTESEGKVRFGQFFLKMILSTSRKGCYLAKMSISSKNLSKTKNGDQNRIYPSLTLQTAKFVPLKGFKKFIRRFL